MKHVIQSSRENLVRLFDFDRIWPLCCIMLHLTTAWGFSIISDSLHKDQSTSLFLRWGTGLPLVPPMSFSSLCFLVVFRCWTSRRKLASRRSCFIAHDSHMTWSHFLKFLRSSRQLHFNWHFFFHHFVSRSLFLYHCCDRKRYVSWANSDIRT